MQARMSNPAMIMPDAMKAILAMDKAVKKGTVPTSTLELVHLRVSQINGCAPCVDGGVRHAKQAGETDQRLFAVSVWRETPYFTDAERAALALGEAVTRISDNPEAVPDAVWDEATKHYDEQALAALLMSIATTNVWNRLNVATRQLPGGW